MTRNDLTRRQKKFVAAMMVSKTIGAAAEKAGVSLSTATRYLRLSSVKRALGQQLDVALAGATTRCVSAMVEALGTLEAIHLDTETTPAARVSAAKAILDGGPKLREANDLAQRVGELEKRTEQ